jgi:PAS domain S-box-containing protein
MNDENKAGTELKVLYLEDSPQDAEIIRELIIDSGYKLQIDITSTEKEFESFLSAGKYDIILSDFKLPGFDAFGALKLCNEICPCIPFICVSGSIGEETAIELLKGGAVDYVLKDRPERLPFAMKRALDDAKGKIARKKAEELLRESEEKYKSIFDNVQDVFYQIDMEGIIQEISPSIKLFGNYSRDEVINSNVADIYCNPGDRAILLSAIKTKGEILDYEIRLKTKNGSVKYASINARLVLDSNGNPHHIDGTFRDITEKKEMLADLLKAIEDAEEMNRLKSNFMANMSHELRTPLVGLLGISDIMYEELEGEHRENALIIHESGKRLLDTVSLILNFSKLESGKTDVNYSVFNLNQLILNEIKLYQKLASQKGISITEHFSEEDLQIETDEKLLCEIIDNILNNAVKYTVSGAVNVTLDVTDVEFIIKISDTGIGIPKDKLDIIFKEFRQVSEGMSRKFEGTGLGLTIVKKYVELLKGSIEVESEPGVGSIFTIRLPFTYFERVNIPVSVNTVNSKIELAGGSFPTILIVEDDKINEMAIRKMLRKYYNTISVTNGRLAIEEVKKQDIDIILMDINLRDEMDGIKTTNLIRKISGYENKPIVALTAFAMPGDREKFLGSGFSHYLSKPFDQDEILLLLHDIIKL